MQLAINFSNDKTLGSDAIQDLKEFDSQPLPTKAKKVKQLVFMMPALKKLFDLMGDDIVELSTENETLKKQLSDYDVKWFEESKAKLLIQIDGEKRAKIVMPRMKKQMNKQ